MSEIIVSVPLVLSSKDFLVFMDEAYNGKKTSFDVLDMHRAFENGRIQQKAEFEKHLRLFEDRIRKIAIAVGLPDYAGVDVDDRIERQIERLKTIVNIISRVASGEYQVADNDTEAMAWIQYFVETELELYRKEWYEPN